MFYESNSRFSVLVLILDFIHEPFDEVNAQAARCSFVQGCGDIDDFLLEIGRAHV